MCTWAVSCHALFSGQWEAAGEVHFAGWLALNSIYFLNIFFGGSTHSSFVFMAATGTQGRSCDDWRFFLISKATRNRANIDDLAHWVAGIGVSFGQRPTNWLTDRLWPGIFISQLLKQRHLRWSPFPRFCLVWRF